MCALQYFAFTSLYICHSIFLNKQFHGSYCLFPITVTSMNFSALLSSPKTCPSSWQAFSNIVSLWWYRTSANSKWKWKSFFGKDGTILLGEKEINLWFILGTEGWQSLSMYCKQRCIIQLVIFDLTESAILTFWGTPVLKVAVRRFV